MMNNPKDRSPKRERRWQTSQERARVAAELIEEAESLTQTGAIASPNDVARDRQPPPIRVAPLATPAPQGKLDQETTPPAPSEEPTAPPSSSSNLYQRLGAAGSGVRRSFVFGGTRGERARRGRARGGVVPRPAGARSETREGAQQPGAHPRLARRSRRRARRARSRAGDRAG